MNFQKRKGQAQYNNIMLFSPIPSQDYVLLFMALWSSGRRDVKPTMVHIIITIAYNKASN